MTSLTYDQFVQTVVERFPLEMQAHVDLYCVAHPLADAMRKLWESLSSSESSCAGESWVNQGVELVNELTGALEPYCDDVDYAHYAQWVADKERDR